MGLCAGERVHATMDAEIGYAAIGVDFTDGSNTLKAGPDALTGINAQVRA